MNGRLKPKASPPPQDLEAGRTNFLLHAKKWKHITVRRGSGISWSRLSRFMIQCLGVILILVNITFMWLFLLNLNSTNEPPEDDNINIQPLMKLEHPFRRNGNNTMIGECLIEPETYYIKKSYHFDFFLSERLDSLGWTRRTILNESVHFVFPDRSEDPKFYKLTRLDLTSASHQEGCLNQIVHFGQNFYTRRIEAKRKLYYQLIAYSRQTGANIDFLPRTWKIDQYDELIQFFSNLPCEAKTGSMWIFKKSGSARGQNIFIESKPQDIRMKFHAPFTLKYDRCGKMGFINSTFPFGEDLKTLKLTRTEYLHSREPWKDYVVQEYISNLLVIDERKFHVRAYWLVASMNPLYLLYFDSYLMLATEKFDSSSTDRNKHISNHYVSQPSNLELSDTKKSLSFFQDYINEHFNGQKNFTTDSYIQQVTHIGRICWNSLVGKIEGNNENFLGKWKFVATDLMITSDFEVKLLEWQRNPGMDAMGKGCVDKRMKWGCNLGRRMAAESLKIIIDVQDRMHRRKNFDGIVTDDMKFRVVVDRSPFFKAPEESD